MHWSSRVWVLVFDTYWVVRRRIYAWEDRSIFSVGVWINRLYCMLRRVKRFKALTWRCDLFSCRFIVVYIMQVHNGLRRFFWFTILTCQSYCDFRKSRDLTVFWRSFLAIRFHHFLLETNYGQAVRKTLDYL